MVNIWVRAVLGAAAVLVIIGVLIGGACSSWFGIADDGDDNGNGAKTVYVCQDSRQVSDLADCSKAATDGQQTSAPQVSADQLKTDFLAEVDRRIAQAQGGQRRQLEELRSQVVQMKAETVRDVKDMLMQQIRNIQPQSGQQSPASTGVCRVINDYGLELKPEVATSGSQIHVEYWWDGQPERETLIPAGAAPGGRFLLARPLKGHVREYADCQDGQVMDQIRAHIERRKAGGADNAGYVDWKTTGLFKPAVLQSAAQPGASADSCQAQQATMSVGGNYVISGPAIVNVWTNRASPPPWGQTEVKVMVPSGSVDFTNVGGTAYNYPAGCDVSGDFARNSLPARDLAELRQYGLVR